MPMGIRFCLEEGTVHLDREFSTHKQFLRWLRSGAVPEDLRVGYIENDVWIESMPERAFAHNRLTTRIAAVLMPLVDESGFSTYFGDGMTYTSEGSGFTTVPDGIIVTSESALEGRVRLKGGRKSHRDTELVGSPDLVIEVVSQNSEHKDLEWLMTWYWDAGIGEYWTVDGREDPVDFQIHRAGPKGYITLKRNDGWLKSPLLGRSFRFVPGRPNAFGKSDYSFEIR
jgi:Uma2 family endonuclease